MQNKGAIRLFAILLALVCVYQLSFTLVSSMVKKEATKYATDEKTGTVDLKKEAAYLDSISGKVVYNLGIKKYTFKEVREREINLGLDLKGGMNVTMEVSVADIIRALSNYSTDTTFNKALALATKMQGQSQQDYVTLFGRAFEQVDPNAKLAAVFNTFELKDRVTFNSTNEEVLRVIRTEANSAIDNSFNILRSRIDRFGVTSPNIQKLETNGRILIELPGVKEQDRVRKLLQGTANLEFWETYENPEIFAALAEANTRIKEYNEAGGKQSAIADTATVAAVADTSVVKPDTANTSAQLAGALKPDTSKMDSTVADSTAKSIDEFKKNMPLFAVLRPNINQENQPLPGSVVGYAHFTDTAKVNYYLNLKQVKSVLPRDVKFYWAVKPFKFDASESVYELHAIKVTGRDGRAPLDGGVVTNARAEFGQTKASAEVTMSMNGEGAKIWARLTKENVGRCIAIVLDDYVYSSPRVNSEIKGGNSSITGDFSISEAQDLANILKSGKMPAPARIVQENVVGPSLGKEAISAGLSSFVIAFIVVLLYMIFYYNRAGWVADVALIVNVFLIIGVLASIGAVLTLPGIAGIVLTLGMAVDANVIIYERIREELRAGKGVRLAVTDGYKHAYSAIIDGNVTTFLTGLILFIFGSGPIQGFATTLMIGILTSLFTAIFISRLIFERLLSKDKNVSFSNSLTEDVLVHANYDFIGVRKYFYIFSTVILLVGVISIFVRGFNLGVDFKGGRTYVVRFDNPVNTVDIQKDLEGAFGMTPEVKTFGNDKQVKIATKFMIDENTQFVNVDSIVETRLFEGLKPVLGDNVSFDQFTQDHIMSSDKVGPTIADDVKRSAVLAVVFSLLGIFLYIYIRFKGWAFGLGGVLSLAHDALFLLGAYSLLWGFLPFSLEIDQAFIAAILTVIGYSINDTVIVYDRIREYGHLYPKRDRLSTYNAAINSTLGRTMNTALTTLFTLIVIFIFGGEVIRGFVFALLIGIAMGTYSSVFIATPVLYDTLSYFEKRKARKA